MKPIEPGLYDRLKFIAQIVLPALAALYFALAGIWNLPAAEQVVGTLAAIDTFLGAVLHLASTSYQSSDTRFGGEIQVAATPSGGKSFTLALNEDPHDLDQKSEVTFKVVKPNAPGLVLQTTPVEPTPAPAPAPAAPATPPTA